MRAKKIFLWTYSIVILLFVGSCNENDIDLAPDPFTASEEGFQVTVEDGKQIVFGSQAKESFTVTVKSSLPWKVTKNTSWIDVELKDDGQHFVVTAQKNRSIENRSATITVSAGDVTETFDIMQTKGKVRVYTVNGDSGVGVGGIPAKGVSLNGRFVVGSSSAGTWVCDLDEVDPGNEITMNIDVSKLRYLRPSSTTYRAVSNYGEIIGDGITPDGRIKIAFKTVSSYNTPYVIREGWKIELPHPKEAQMGQLLPHHGYETKGISADGKYIVGKHITYRGGYAECGWKYNETTGMYDYIFYPEGVILNEEEWTVNSPNPESVSPEGKYVAGRYYPWGVAGINYPYYRDLSTGEMTILKQFAGRGAIFITDDGILGTGEMLGSTSIVDIHQPESITSLKDWIAKTYKIDPDEYGIINGLMYTMIPDKSTLAWSYTPKGKQITWSMILTIE